MMAGRPAQRIGRPRADRHQIGRGLRRVGCRPDRLPAARPDQGHGVVAEPPDPGMRRGRRPQRQPGQHPGGGEHVRQHPIAPVPGHVAAGLPLRPHGAQVLDQRIVVHGPEHLIVVRDGGHDCRSRRAQGGKDGLGALRQLGAPLADAQPYLAARLVPQALLAPDDRDGQAGCGWHQRTAGRPRSRG